MTHLCFDDQWDVKYLLSVAVIHRGGVGGGGDAGSGGGGGGIKDDLGHVLIMRN